MNDFWTSNIIQHIKDRHMARLGDETVMSWAAKTAFRYFTFDEMDQINDGLSNENKPVRDRIWRELTVAAHSPMPDGLIVLEHDIEGGDRSLNVSRHDAKAAADRLGVPVMLLENANCENRNRGDGISGAFPVALPEGATDLAADYVWIEESWELLASALPLDVRHLRDEGAMLSDVNPQKALAKMDGEALLNECAGQKLNMLSTEQCLNVARKATLDSLDIGSIGDGDAVTELRLRATARAGMFMYELGRRRGRDTENIAASR